MHHYMISNHVATDEAEKAAPKSCTVICISLLAWNTTETPLAVLSELVKSSARGDGKE
jgi:hypothetical protein